MKVEEGYDALVLRDSDTKISRIYVWAGIREGILIVPIIPDNALLIGVQYTFNGKFAGSALSL